MSCLRCGRDTKNQQVFCAACLEHMARYPVRSDAPVYLPTRKNKDTPRKQRRWQRKERSTEETITVLRTRVRVLTALCVVLAMMLSAAAVGVWFATRQGADNPLDDFSRNFSSVTDIFDNKNED